MNTQNFKDFYHNGVYIIQLKTMCSGTWCCWLFFQFLPEFKSFSSKILVQQQEFENCHLD
jgi:hypothetical protein